MPEQWRRVDSSKIRIRFVPGCNCKVGVRHEPYSCDEDNRLPAPVCRTCGQEYRAAELETKED